MFFLLALVSALRTAAQEVNGEKLLKAARTGDIKTLQELLDQKTDVNFKNRYGQTALGFAVDANSLAAVTLLLDRGADPNVKDSFYNSTVLGWAIYKKNTAIISALINHGANIKDEEDVMGAVYMGLTEIVKLMLDKGAPGAGKALMTAIGNHDTAMVALTMDYNLKNDTVLSEALVYATAMKNQLFIDRLTGAGAKMPPEQPQTFSGKADETLAGSYNAGEMSKAELTVTDGVLSASFDGSPPYLLKQLSDTTFQFKDYPTISLTVQRTAGKVTGITLVQPERSSVYLKAMEKPASKPVAPVEEDLARAVKQQNWPAFRGEGNAGTADGQHPPVRWDAVKDNNMRWKTYIPGLAHASPVVWKNDVFLITACSSDTTAEYRVGLFGDTDPANDTSWHAWKIYCLDRISGVIKWEKKAYEGIPRVKRHVKASQANSSPVTNGEYVVALFGSEGMVCYDLKGNEKWRKDLGKLDAGWFFNDATQWGHSSSPVIYKNTVILQADRSEHSFIAAYDLKTGNEVWNTPREEISSWGTPAIVKGKTRDELVTNATRFIRGYDPATGKELWRLTPNSEITVGSPVFADSLIFVTAGYPPVQPVYAIKTGAEGDISIPDSAAYGKYIQWRKKRGGTYMPSPIVYNGYLYTLSNSGQLICYQAATGEIRYKETIKNGGAFTASPVIADGKIYCTSEEKGVFVVRAGPEYELLSVNPVGEICMATPAISLGMIFVRGQHHLFCFSVEN